MTNATIHPAMPFAEYLADPSPEPSLTAGTARELLETAPLAIWTGNPRLNPDYAPPASEAKFDKGSASHELLIGGEDRIRIIEADSYRTKAAQAARFDAAIAGETPLLRHQYEAALPMADAARLFLGETRPLRLAVPDALAEATIVWRAVGKVWGRCRPDWMVPPTEDRAPLIIHYKTTGVRIGAGAVKRYAFNSGWHITWAHYRAGYKAAYGIEPRQLWLVQENTAPFLCRCGELDGVLEAEGEKRWKAAWRLWGRCLRTDRWPAYPADVETIDAPGWLDPTADATDEELDEWFPDEPIKQKENEQ